MFQHKTVPSNPKTLEKKVSCFAVLLMPFKIIRSFNDRFIVKSGTQPDTVQSSKYEVCHVHSASLGTLELVLCNVVISKL